MNDSNKAATTVSIPFIFLKQKGPVDPLIRKIPFPASYESLMRTAVSTFRHIMDVQTLFTENGKRFVSIEEIIPGSVVYVSDKDANGECESPIRNIPPSPMRKKNRLMSKDSYNKLFGGDASLQPAQITNDENHVFSLNEGLTAPSSPSKVRPKYTPKKIREQQRIEEEEARKVARREAFEREMQEHENSARIQEIQSVIVNNKYQLGASEDSSTEPIPKPKDGTEKRTKKPANVLTSASLIEREKMVMNKNQTQRNQEKEQSHKKRSKSPRTSGAHNSNYNEDNEDMRSEGSYRSKGDQGSVSSVSQEPKMYSAQEYGKMLAAEAQQENAVHKHKHRRRKNKDTSETTPSENSENVFEQTHDDENTNENLMENQAEGEKKRRKHRRKKHHNEQDHQQQQNDSFENKIYDDDEQDSDFSPQVTPTQSPQVKTEKKQSVRDNIDYSEEIDETHLRETIDDVVNPNAFSDCLQTAIRLLDPSLHKPITTLPDLEKEQSFAWYSKGIKIAEEQNLLPLDEDLYGKDHMIGKARCLVMDQKFTYLGGTTHHFNIGIVGPQESGKTSFLRLLSEEVLIDLVATDEWKKTFVVFLNVENVVNLANDVAQFYKAFVEITMEALAWHRPSAIPIIPAIQNVFQNIPDYSRAPKFSKNFCINEEMTHLANQLQKIANNLSEVWNDDSAMITWFINTVKFPQQIANIFGFTNVLFIIDNFDVADVQVHPSHPFTSTNEFMCLTEFLKFMIGHTDFIVACRDQNWLYRTLSPLNNDEFDMTNKMAYATMVDLISEQTYEDKQINIELRDDISPSVLNIDHCGGVPAFLHLWNELNRSIDQIESSESVTEEQKIELCVQTQEVIRRLFVKDIDDNETAWEVVNVKRVARNH